MRLNDKLFYPLQNNHIFRDHTDEDPENSYSLPNHPDFKPR